MKDKQQIIEKYSNFIGSVKLVSFEQIPPFFYEGKGLWGWRE